MRGIVVGAVTSAVALALVAPGTTAAAPSPSGRAHVATVGTHYSVFKRLCSEPAPGHAACMAVRRVSASKTTANARPYTVTNSFPVGPSGFGLTPGDFASAYGYNPDAAAGANQLVAIVDAYDDPNILGDLNTFNTQYGLPAETSASFSVVGQTGSTTALPTTDTTGWSGEEALDVETVRGVCHLCRIVLVETNSDSNPDLELGVHAAAKLLHATEISNSYGGAEPTGAHPSKADLRAAERPYDLKGIVVTAATGDDGWSQWDHVNDGLASAEGPNLPSSLPQVVSVGGTALRLNADGTRRSEAVWNENGKANSVGIAADQSQGASGGGCSHYFPAEGWQAHVANYAKTGCGKFRLAADVAADADPNTGYDVYSSFDCGTACEPMPTNGWEPVGGTSLSTPLVAALWALAGGAGGVAYPALSLYGHFTATPSSLYDVTKGGNSWCNHDTRCAADTAAQIPNVKNPNALFFGGTSAVGTLDCGFQTHTVKPTKIANNRQCNAATGYDGPSGVGTPNGLTSFEPLNPTATIRHTEAAAAAKTTFWIDGHDPFPGAKFVAISWVIDGKKFRGAAPTVVFMKPGEYTATVAATDNYGRSAVATSVVKVTQ